jgi:hypothetical protein
MLYIYIYEISANDLKKKVLKRGYSANDSASCIVLQLRPLFTAYSFSIMNYIFKAPKDSSKPNTVYIIYFFNS